VAGQYQIAGTLAHGGLGWIYLARNRNVEGMWVVLKGLLHGGDPEAVQLAIAERRFLATVNHEYIVQIHNFVEHEGAGYIVMEYVAGTSLREVSASHRKATGQPLPVDQAIAYALGMLDAIGYLHEMGLLYCDLKPENVIRTPRSLKLIDLGGVHRIDDQTSAVYGTPGYQAPEIAESGASVASDLYTVGRTLAVLCTDFRGYRDEPYRYGLPEAEKVPQYSAFESLYRFLVKATQRAPEHRFESAEEMADQLYGVLHEVSAVTSSTPARATSTLFAPPDQLRGALVDWRSLPVPLRGGDAPPDMSLEAELQVSRALIDAGRWIEVGMALDRIASERPRDWRVSWHRGLAALAANDPTTALQWFDAVSSEVPGELAPRLASGAAAERDQRFDTAARLYDVLSRTDPAFVVAAFGLARCSLALGDETGAVAALERVPPASGAYIEARVARARLVARSPIANDDLVRTGSDLERLALDEALWADLRRELLTAALDRITAGVEAPDPALAIAGYPLTDAGLRQGIEQANRTSARLAPSWHERIKFVDRANQIRPRSWT
jgi:serine/threonine-protein kinase PknG